MTDAEVARLVQSVSVARDRLLLAVTALSNGQFDEAAEELNAAGEALAEARESLRTEVQA